MHRHPALRSPSTALFSVASLPSMLATLMAGGAFAHPGHGTTSADSPSHYLAEPLHLALLVAAVVAGGAFVALVRRQRGADRR